jgi:hypothetical protein
VADLTRQHFDLVERKIEDLLEMRSTLALNLKRCTGAAIPECPVLDFLNEPV